MKRSPLKRNKPLRAKVGLTEKSTEAILGLLPQVKRASTFTATPKPMRKRAKNNPGWVSVAKAMWNDPENDHCCRVCRVWLGDDFSPTFYHHLLHRGSYKKFARDPRNLIQVCVKHHDIIHKHGVEALADNSDLDPGGPHGITWKIVCLQWESLLQEANGLRPETGSDAEGGVPPKEDRAEASEEGEDQAPKTTA